MQGSAWDEAPTVNNKNKSTLFWIIVGIVISVLFIAAICIPLGVILTRNANNATTSSTTTTIATTTAVPTTTGGITTVATTTSGK